MIAKVLSSFPRAEDLITKPHGLEGAEIFGSLERKLDLPPGSHNDSHRQDKVNFSVPCMSTRCTRARIEEALLDPIHAPQVSNIQHVFLKPTVIQASGTLLVFQRGREDGVKLCKPTQKQSVIQELQKAPMAPQLLLTLVGRRTII